MYAKSMGKKIHEKSSPRHHKNSPREKTDGGSFLLGIWKKSPCEKKNNLRAGTQYIRVQRLLLICVLYDLGLDMALKLNLS